MTKIVNNLKNIQDKPLNKSWSKKGSIKVVLVLILCIFLAICLIGLGLWYLISFKNAGVIIPVPPTVKDVAPSLESKVASTTKPIIKSIIKIETKKPQTNTGTTSPIRPI